LVVPRLRQGDLRGENIQLRGASRGIPGVREAQGLLRLVHGPTGGRGEFGGFLQGGERTANLDIHDQHRLRTLQTRLFQLGCSTHDATASRATVPDWPVRLDADGPSVERVAETLRKVVLPQLVSGDQ